MVAVDGPSDADSRGFADDLADSLRIAGHKVFRCSIGDFHRPKALWDDGDPAVAWYWQSFDYSVFTRVLLDPFRAGGSTSFVLAAFDLGADAQVQPKWSSAGADAILIVDGQFLNRPELAGQWNYSLWLDTGSDPEGADALYASESAPRTKAVAIIDVREPEHPRRQFADSC